MDQSIEQLEEIRNNNLNLISNFLDDNLLEKFSEFKKCQDYIEFQKQQSILDEWQSLLYIIEDENNNYYKNNYSIIQTEIKIQKLIMQFGTKQTADNNLNDKKNVVWNLFIDTFGEFLYTYKIISYNDIHKFIFGDIPYERFKNFIKKRWIDRGSSNEYQKILQELCDCESKIKELYDLKFKPEKYNSCLDINEKISMLKNAN